MSTETTPTRMDDVLRNVKAEMARRDLTQTQLANALGVSQVAVSKRLRGLVPLSVPELLTIADLLRVPAGSLIEDAA